MAWKVHYCAAHIAFGGTANAVTFGGMTNAITTMEDAAITPETFAHLDSYLDNLASASTTNHTTLTQLIENYATLTSNVTALTASVTALTSAYTLLANAQGAAPAAIPMPMPPLAPGQKGRKKTNLDPNRYC